MPTRSRAGCLFSSRKMIISQPPDGRLVSLKTTTPNWGGVKDLCWCGPALRDCWLNLVSSDWELHTLRKVWQYARDKAVCEKTCGAGTVVPSVLWLVLTLPVVQEYSWWKPPNVPSVSQPSWDMETIAGNGLRDPIDEVNLYFNELDPLGDREHLIN